MSPEEQFLAQLKLIERVIDSICRRHRCYGADAEDFSSKVKLKLIDDDYAVFRKFQGKSLLATYLTTVVANLFRDQRIREWGKWRPSAAAKRQGPEGILLDQFLSRDGYTFDEAVAKLQTDHRVTLSRDELYAMAIQLPQRTPRRLETDEPLEQLAAADEVDQRVRDRDRAELARKTEVALNEALARLPPEDRLIIQMRFDDFTVAKIAKILGLRQRPLYSRIEKVLKQLRLSLETRGLSREQMREIFGWKGFDIRVNDTSEGENEGEDEEEDDEKSQDG